MVAEGADNKTPNTPPVRREGTGSLDMANERDRGAVRQAVRQWPKRFRGIDDDFKDEIVSGLKEAGRLARAALTDPERSWEAVREVNSIAKTTVAIETLHQKDEHEARQDERERAALDKPDGPTIIVISAPPRARLD